MHDVIHSVFSVFGHKGGVGTKTRVAPLKDLASNVWVKRNGGVPVSLMDCHMIVRCPVYAVLNVNYPTT